MDRHEEVANVSDDTLEVVREGRDIHAFNGVEGTHINCPQCGFAQNLSILIDEAGSCIHCGLVMNVYVGWDRSELDEEHEHWTDTEYGN